MDMSPALEYLRNGSPFLNTAASPPTYHFQLPSWNSSAAEIIRGNNINAQQLPVSNAPRGPVSINNGEHPYLLVLIEPSAFDQTRPPGVGYARLKTWDPSPAPTMATISAPIERINPIEALVAAKTLSSILNLAAVCEELNDGRDEHD
ncbi:hypothetical protein KCU71_g6510, partial [Aureobasidium melanogenum]